MGCCAANDHYFTSDIDENILRENLQKLYFSLDEVDNYFTKKIGISLEDIDSNEWYEKEKYIDILKFITKSYQTTIITRENPLLYFFIEFESNNKNFHEIFTYQLVCLSNDSTKTKIEFLIKLIKMNCKPLNLNQFKKSISRYLYVNLITLTENFFTNFDQISSKSSFSQIFNDKNLEKIYKIICDDLDILIKKNKPLIDENGLKNEFVTDDIMIDFFKKHKYILKSMELRIYFYNFSSDNFRSYDDERLSFNLNIKSNKIK